MSAKDDIKYQSGFGNHFESEALSGALPIGQNSPQKPPHGLYAEQLSGTAFTAPTLHNQKSWLYRILPSVCQKPFELYSEAHLHTTNRRNTESINPNPLRWNPVPYPQEKKNFIQSLQAFCFSGNALEQTGSGVYLYAANASMENEYFYNSDGDLLVVPQEGELLFKTEFGLLEASPGEIVVIPRGIKFQVELKEEKARGYVCENYGQHFRLPDRGPIGSNGLANQRDFLAPVSWYEEKQDNFQLITKFCGEYWTAEIKNSPLDVVAWHGNYYPYKYDLSRFQVVNTVNFDHSDPSIFTVLTSPSHQYGTANVDFVIFPPRWSVAENTFRPPYYHRNVMSEYMGLIHGVYDAKQEGFLPGGGSLHNCMSAHGPDAETFTKASEEDLKPVYVKDTLAIMFESSLVYQPTEFATKTNLLQKDYYKCWQGLRRNFER